MNFDSFEDIKVLMDNFDPASLLPDLGTIVGKVAFITRIAVLIGPVVLLVLGLAYLLLAPKEANYHFGYRCFFGMGSVPAWRFTQRLAGLVWGVLGLLMTIAMFFITAGFTGEILEIIRSGIICLLWEAGLIALSMLIINILVMIRYNSKGDLRDHSGK